MWGSRVWRGKRGIWENGGSGGNQFTWGSVDGTPLIPPDDDLPNFQPFKVRCLWRWGSRERERERETTGYEPLALHAPPNTGLCKGMWSSRLHVGECGRHAAHPPGRRPAELPALQSAPPQALIRNSTPLGPYRRTLRRALWWQGRELSYLALSISLLSMLYTYVGCGGHAAHSPNFQPFKVLCYSLLLSSLDFSDTKVYAPWIRALLGTVSYSCEVVAHHHCHTPGHAGIFGRPEPENPLSCP